MFKEKAVACFRLGPDLYQFANMIMKFCSELGRALRRPSLLPVPGAVLKLLLGDGAEVVLQGQQVLPQKLQAQQFAFQAPQLDQALALSLKG